MVAVHAACLYTCVPSPSLVSPRKIVCTNKRDKPHVPSLVSQKHQINVYVFLVVDLYLYSIYNKYGIKCKYNKLFYVCRPTYCLSKDDPCHGVCTSPYREDNSPQVDDSGGGSGKM